MTEPRTDREQQIQTRPDPETTSDRQMTNRSPQATRRRSSSAPTHPLEMMRRLTEQMFGPLVPRAAEVWMPSIEVSERDGKLHVTADLPGMTKDDVRVEVRDNNLIIEGERKQEKKEDREGYFVTERTYGSFYRVVPLPDDVDPQTARATFRDGVLELTMDLPRDHRAHSRRIPIEESKSEASS